MKRWFAALAGVTGLAAAQESTLAWVINAHTSADCSDPAPFGYNGFDVPWDGYACISTQLPANVKSVWFRDSETAAHGLYLSPPGTCLEAGTGRVPIPSGTGGICIPLTAAGEGVSLHRAVHATSPAGSRLPSALAVRASAELAAMPDRAFWDWFHSRRNTAFAHVGALVAGCVVFAPGACGFAIGVAVIESVFLIWESVDRYREGRAGTNKRSDSLLSITEMEDHSMNMIGYLDGTTVNVKPIDMSHSLSKRDAMAIAGRDLDETHEYYEMAFTDDATGATSLTFVDIDPATNASIASGVGGATNYRIGTGDLMKRDLTLAKRQSNADAYTVHYVSQDLDENTRDMFPMSRGAAEELFNDAWAWGFEQNIGGHCSSLRRRNGGSVNRGYLSIKSGPFTAHRDCPRG